MTSPMSDPSEEVKAETPPAWLVDLYERTGGKAWEPRDITGPGIQRWIDRGYFRKVDGRVGFELLKDAMLAWTDAGAAACRSALKPKGEQDG